MFFLLYIYISRKISIEHPSVGLALFAQLGKLFPLQGELAQSLKKKFFLKTNIKLNPFLYALLSSSVSMANLSCVVSTTFSSLAFLSSSVSMANLSSLVGPSFSSFAVLYSFLSTANQSCLLATSFSSLRFLSNSFSSPRFNL